MERTSIASWKSLATTILLIQIFIIPSLGASLCTHPESPPAEHRENAGPGYRADCDFQNTLCYYTQGCRDPEMTNWTATNNGTVARQSYIGAGAYVHSVLESPLLSLDHVSCVEFRYTNHLPSDLDLFATVNGTDINLFQRPVKQYPTGNTVFETVAKDTSKLKFRASGGGGGVANPPVSLQYVTIHTGSCTGPACDFTTADMCGWGSTSWELRSPGYVQIQDNRVSGTLTTNLVKATTGGGLCLTFHYSMNSINDTLSVSIQHLDGTEQPVWATPAHSWSQVWMHIHSATAFQLVFRAVRCNNLHSRIAIKAVTSSPYTYPANCESRSPGDKNHVSPYEGCSITTTTVPTESTTMSSSSLPTTSPLPFPPNATAGKSGATGGVTEWTGLTEGKEKGQDTNVAGIVGSVVAGVVVIAVVFVAVLFWKKHKPTGGNADGADLQAVTLESVCVPVDRLLHPLNRRLSPMGVFRNSGWTFVTIAILVIPGFLCQSLRTSVCRKSPDPVRTGETAVHGYKAGCMFIATLCKYTQGCRDPGMTNWTVTGPVGGAVAKQSDPGAGPNTYSVLESPLFRLDHVSCVMFTYTNRLPSDLDVLGVANGKTTEIFPGPRNENTNGRSIKVTVSKDLSMLKFRADGGGGGAAYPPVRLLQVAIRTGRCTGPECNFTLDGRPTWCGWTNTGWELSPPVVQLKELEVNGTLMTDLTKTSPPAGGLCVEFDYYMDSINDTLSVSIQYMGGSEEPVWATACNGTSLDGWPTVRMLIKSDSAFRLVFRAVRCNDPQSRIAIKSVTSEPYYSSDCEGKSPGAVKQVPLYEGCDLTTTTPVTTQSTAMSSPLTEYEWQDSVTEGKQEVAAIAGSVVAGVVVVAVVIIAVLLWNKRTGGNVDEAGISAREPSEQSQKEEETSDYLNPYNIPGELSPASQYSALQFAQPDTGAGATRATYCNMGQGESSVYCNVTAGFGESAQGNTYEGLTRDSSKPTDDSHAYQSLN